MSFKKAFFLVGFLAMTTLIFNFSLPPARAYEDPLTEELEVKLLKLQELLEMIREIQKQLDELRKQLDELIGANIKVISPNGGEQWMEGKNHVIYWEQRGLEKWGNRAKICLIGFDSSGQPIAVRGDRQNSACAYAESSQGLASYLITETSLTNGKYNWEISNDILKTFEKTPVNYKVSILVFDELPQVQRTEWAGLIDQAESNGYFNIVSKLKEELCGDVNANGRIDIGDVVLLRNHIVYPEQYPVSSKWVADVNCDGAINILDIVLLQNYVGYPGKYQLRCCGLSCQNLWWHDNNHQYCQQKQFCGAYMYPGLYTFKTKEECEVSLKKPSITSITVMSPNGGEKWTIGNTYSIAWSSAGVNKVNISYYRKGGPISLCDGCCDYNLIAENVSASLGKYFWTVPSNFSAGEYKILIRDSSISPVVPPCVNDFSDNYFSIVSASTACADSDGGKNYYVRGTVADNGKTYTDYCYGAFSVKEYFCLDGSSLGLGRVAEEVYVCPNQQSCKDGVCLVKCDGVNMTWDSDLIKPKPYSYTTDTCAGYRCLIGNGISPSCYNFAECQNACKGECVNIPAAKKQCATTPSINVMSPNGGESLVRGQAYEIRWEAGGINEVNIELLNSAHKAYSERIAVNYTNTGTYRWTIPLDPQTIRPTHNYVISVSDSYGPAEARSAEFSIVSPPAIVLCDNYGDVNYDGHLSMADASFIADYIAGSRDFNQEQKLRADVNQDGQINILDVATINQYLAGEITAIPACQKIPPCGNYGDLTGSGFVNLRDVKLINDCILGMSSCTAEHRRRADVNNDGRVDILDATLVNRYISSLDSTFPVCKLSSITITFPREGQEIKSGAYGRIDWNISGGESGQTIYVDRKMPGEDWRRISGPLQHDVTAFFWQAPYVDIPTNVGIRVGLWSKEGNLLVSDIVTVRVMPETPIITLEKGWNLFSPSVEEGITISAMRSEGCSIEAVYSWNPVTRGYDWFSGSSYRLEPDKGYWVAVLENCNFSLPGTPWYFSRTSYNAGTHLIGSAYETIEVADVLGTCHLGKTKVKTQLNFYNGTYQEVSTMLPFKAYWLELEESCFFGTKPPEQMILTSTEY